MFRVRNRVRDRVSIRQTGIRRNGAEPPNLQPITITHDAS